VDIHRRRVDRLRGPGVPLVLEEEEPLKDEAEEKAEMEEDEEEKAEEEGRMWRRRRTVNEVQYYYSLYQIQPDDTDTCIAHATSNGDIEERGYNCKI
jgi:hypothetical protein